MKNLERSRKYADGSTEWYTLSENLYRAYLVTGDDRYRTFAKVWEYTPYWKHLRPQTEHLRSAAGAGARQPYSTMPTATSTPWWRGPRLPGERRPRVLWITIENAYDFAPGGQVLRHRRLRS